MLSPGGLVAVDDFLNPVAIGVNRAVNAFMESAPGLVEQDFFGDPPLLYAAHH